jgi:hypothetical protein
LDFFCGNTQPHLFLTKVLMSSHHTVFLLVVLKRLKVKDQRTSFSIFFGGALGGGKLKSS